MSRRSTPVAAEPPAHELPSVGATPPGIRGGAAAEAPDLLTAGPEHGRAGRQDERPQQGPVELGGGPGGHGDQPAVTCLQVAAGRLQVFRRDRGRSDRHRGRRPSGVTVAGKPLVDYLPHVQIWDDDVIRRRDAPLQDNAGIAVLRGTLAPDRAVIKPAAASKELLVHRGRAVVFDSIEELHARLDDPDLDIDETCVLVLGGCGPKGYPGMPDADAAEAGRPGCPRPDPHQRRPDEWHGVRHRRAARSPGIGSGRPAVARPERRHDRARRPRPMVTPGRAGRPSSGVAWRSRRRSSGITSRGAADAPGR